MKTKINHKAIWQNGMVGMTIGFMASLVVGTLIGLIAIGPSNQFTDMIKNIKNVLIYSTGFFIGIGVGIKHKVHPVKILALGIGAFICGQSLLRPEYISAKNLFSFNASIGINSKIGLPGDVFAAFLTSVSILYIFEIYKKVFRLDIILMPVVGVVIGIIESMFLTYFTSTILVFFQWIIYNSANKNHTLGILFAPIIGTVMGLALSLPTSSAAIAFALQLKGDAATAAMAGTAAQMISFGVLTYLSDRKWSNAFAVGFGSSMLQMKNFSQNPKLLIVPSIVSGLTALLAVAAIPLAFDKTPSLTSGMGTCVLYGQIFTLKDNGFTNVMAYLNVFIMQLLLPFLLTIVVLKLLNFKKQVINVERYKL